MNNAMDTGDPKWEFVQRAAKGFATVEEIIETVCACRSAFSLLVQHGVVPRTIAYGVAHTAQALKHQAEVQERLICEAETALAS